MKKYEGLEKNPRFARVLCGKQRRQLIELVFGVAALLAGIYLLVSPNKSLDCLPLPLGLLLEGVGVIVVYISTSDPFVRALKDETIREFATTPNPEMAMNLFELEVEPAKARGASFAITDNFIILKPYSAKPVGISHSNVVWVYPRKVTHTFHLVPYGVMWSLGVYTFAGYYEIPVNGEETARMLMLEIAKKAPFAFYGYDPKIDVFPYDHASVERARKYRESEVRRKQMDANSTQPITPSGKTKKSAMPAR